MVFICDGSAAGAQPTCPQKKENKSAATTPLRHCLGRFRILLFCAHSIPTFSEIAEPENILYFIMANYGINGFGRIGRNVLRAMSQSDVKRVRAINDLTDTRTLAHLLKWDSVHGRFDGEISFDEQNIIVRGHKIRILKERDPGNLPWKDLGVEVVLESTGFFTSRDKAELHISKAGAKRVLISAPAKNPDATICIGINDGIYDPAKHTVVSNASCTTNCLAPLAKVLHQKFGVQHGFMSTIHSYTNDQRILDFPHDDLRRARAAAINIIPSSTGAAKAIGEVIPELKGKLNGGAFRVPTPDGSVTDFTAVLEKDATVDSINAAFKEAASDKGYKGVLEYSDEPLVSQDIVGNPHSCIFDSKLTLTLGNRFVKVVGWYDNEWGYSNRCVELLAMLGG
jgi:glyceraldehyde 3-phosphate dehydrogenase